MAALKPIPRIRRDLRVLFVGELTNHANLTVPLFAAGYEVGKVASPEYAKEAAQLLQPDAVVFELEPNDPNPFHVAQDILAQYGWRKPLLVALTKHADEATNVRARDAGIHLYAEHPVDPDKLAGVLRRFRAMIADVEGFDPII